MNWSTSENMTQCKEISAHPFHLHSKSTGNGMQNGCSEPHLNGPMTTKEISKYTSSSKHLMNTHKNNLTSATTTGTSSPHHNTPVSLLNPPPKSTIFPEDQSICTNHYQNLFGSLKWISMCTQPELTSSPQILASNSSTKKRLNHMHKSTIRLPTTKCPALMTALQYLHPNTS